MNDESSSNQENLGVVVQQAEQAVLRTGKGLRVAIIVVALSMFVIFLLGVALMGLLVLQNRALLKKIEQGGLAGQTTTQPGEQRIEISPSQGAPMLGSESAPVTIIEYADFQCPFCKQFYDTVFHQIQKEYVDTGKAKLYFQHLTFLGEESFAAAEAASCAADQGQFWPYYETLFAHQGAENSGVFTVTNLKQWGSGIVPDAEMFGQCIDSRKHKDAILSETQAGSQYGVQSTPTIFINGRKFEGVGNFAAYQRIIEEELTRN